MAENVGGIYYDVTLDTAQLVRGQRDVDRALRTAGASFDGFGSKVDAVQRKLTAVAAAVASLATATYLIGQSDAYTKLNAQLALATSGADGLARAQQAVRSIARDSQSDISAIGTLYARIASSTRELGLSQRGVGEITRVVALSMKVSGATAQESASAMLQLSQAFASGVLRGEEFNAVAEASPRLLKALADGMGVPIGRLRAMAAEGKLTSDVLATALPKALQGLEAEAKSVQNISGAFQELKNEVMLFIGQQMEVSGVSRMTAATISSLASRIGSLGDVTGTFFDAAVAGALAFAGVMAGKFLQSITASASAIVQSVGVTKASAAASLQAAEAKTVELTATQGAIVAARTEQLAKLQAANASLAAARASLENTAATLTEANVVQRTVVASIAAARANQARAASIAELAILGRQQAAVTAQIAAAEVALAAAQRQVAASSVAATAASTIASRATQAFGAVVSALGGPIGIAIIAIGALALKWSSVKSAAEEAADITEQAAQRIQRAQSRSSSTPMRDLMSVRDEALAQIAALDAEIKRAEDFARGGRGPQPDESQMAAFTADLDAKREAARGAALAAQRAIDDLKQRQTEEALPGDEQLKPAAPTKEMQEKAQAAEAYYQGLVAQNATALAKIDAEERKALAENEKRRVSDGTNDALYAKARIEIVRRFNRERRELEEKNTREIAELNIAVTVDEGERIEATRAEAFRRADAQARLGVITFAQAEREKARAAFDAARAFDQLTERRARAGADARLAITLDETSRINQIRDEAVRRAEDGYRSGALTFEEAEADKTRALMNAKNAREALEERRQSVVIDTLQLNAGGNQTEALIRAQAEQRLAQNEADRQRDLENEQIYADRAVAIRADMLRRIQDLQRDYVNGQADLLGAIAQFSLALGDALTSGARNASTSYRALFAISKGFALAQGTLSLYSAALKAMDDPTAITPAQKFANYAAVFAAGSSLLGTIASLNYGGGRQYGGPTTAGSLYRINETGRPEMFTGANGAQYMLPTQNGSVTPADKVGGGAPTVIVNWLGQQPVKVTEQSWNPDLRQMHVTIAEAASQVMERRGAMWEAMKTTNTRGKL